MLKRHVSDYEKSARLYPDPLSERTAQAIERARALARRAEREELEPYCNPCAGVVELAALLLNLKSNP